ncbi:hypothetical protein JW935_07010 [candidate division KSB1 bacterium]|nr:hypothetical protein [candidate division KSB1 bacterium]
MPDLSSNKLKEWLSQLSKSDEGKIKLVNLFLTKDQGLIDENLLRSFLIDCLNVCTGKYKSAADEFNHPCRYNDRYFAIARVDHSEIDTGSTLITTMSHLTFMQHMVDPHNKKRVLFAPQAHNLEALRLLIKSIMSKKGWHKADGSLGTPYPNPHHVWFADLSFLEKAINNSSSDSKATEVRDALGLIDTKRNTYLVGIKFPSTILRNMSHLKIARPLFSDLGSKRFAAYLSSTPQRVYDKKWGMTVHLDKLVQGSEICGVPERICSSIPLSDIIDNISVEIFGLVSGNRGDKAGIDDDEVFVSRLKGNHDFQEITDDILTLANVQ